MRIVHVSNFYGPNSEGARTAVREIGAGYSRAGHEYIVISPGTHDAQEVTAYGTLITVSRPYLRSRVHSLVPATRRIEQTLDALGPDRLEVSDRLTLWLLGRWASRNRTPAMMFVHQKLPVWIRQTSVAPNAPRSRATIAVSNGRPIEDFTSIVCTASNTFSQLKGALPGGVRHIPLGVDLEVFSPLHWSGDVRRKYLRGHDVLLVFSGRLAKDKSPHHAIDTLRELRRRGVDACLVIAGTGPLEAHLRRLSENLPVEYIGFLANRSALAALLASADVSLCPGANDTFALAGLESMASGTPVVIALTSGLSEIVAQKGGAVAKLSGVAFADGVQEILAQRIEDRRSSARNCALQYPWSRTVAGLLDLHRDASVPKDNHVDPAGTMAYLNPPM